MSDVVAHAINRAKFFDAVRKPLFGGSILPSQVSGTEALIDMWEGKFLQRTPVTQFSYVLATPFHETDKKMQPIREYGNTAYFTKMYDIRGARPKVAKQLGNTQPGDGARFPGRGYAQLTGRRNYLLATTKLRAMGILSASESLITTPDLAMRQDVAAAVLFEGMEDGWFTGVDLDQTIDPQIDGDEHADFVRARRIINGADRAELIAGYADKFLAALKASQLA